MIWMNAKKNRAVLREAAGSWLRVSEESASAAGFGESAICAGAGLIVSTLAMKRYPRLGTVSTNCELEAESPRTSRILLMAVLRLWSKSTKVSAGQSAE